MCRSYSCPDHRRHSNWSAKRRPAFRTNKAQGFASDPRTRLQNPPAPVSPEDLCGLAKLKSLILAMTAGEKMPMIAADGSNLSLNYNDNGPRSVRGPLGFV